jgi:hypothetical protein
LTLDAVPRMPLIVLMCGMSMTEWMLAVPLSLCARVAFNWAVNGLPFWRL